MITITLRLSESLLCIFRDTGAPKKETIQCRAESGITVNEILAGQHISPLLVPMVSLDTGVGNKKISRDTVIKTDVVLTLYGPLAGG